MREAGRPGPNHFIWAAIGFALRGSCKLMHGRYVSLARAERALDAFDDVTGEPLSWQPASDEIQIHQWARPRLA